jgi:L-amino acid N-acyltransferase YncA
MIAIRAAMPGDAAAIAAIYAPHVLTGTVSFEVEPPDARAMRTRMAASDGLYPWLVVTEDSGGEPGGGVLGYAYATKFRERAAYRYVVETSIYVADVAQRQGAGRLLYKALIDTLKAQGFVHAIGAIALPNDASIRLHEAVGFRRAGVYREVGYKHGAWIDVGIWQCELNAPAIPPAEPRPFEAVGVVRA